MFSCNIRVKEAGAKRFAFEAEPDFSTATAEERRVAELLNAAMFVVEDYVRQRGNAAIAAGSLTAVGKSPVPLDSRDLDDVSELVGEALKRFER